MSNKKAINIEIGQNLKHIRETMGLTQDQFAELLGFGDKHISKIERGNVGLSLDSLKHICSTLSITSDYLIFGERSTVDDESLELLIERMRRQNPDDLTLIKAVLSQLINHLNSTKTE